MLNIVVVEDNDDLREAIVGALTTGANSVTGVDSAENLLDLPSLAAVDLMLVDINLPGADGLDLTRRVRAAQPDVGVIMVTARDGPRNRTLGYESGADIYLTKPISFEELNAAVGALRRRLRGEGPTDQALLSLDRKEATLVGPIGSVTVSQKELQLIAAFCLAPGTRLENWQILEIIDPGQKTRSRSVIGVTILRLARKLVDVGAKSHPFYGVRGWGYQLRCHIRVK
jgi:DNA-binding response OmpR family regulator